MEKRVVLKIYGKVQGVFFRSSSLKKAKELGLSGWVMNESDGAVRIVAEGEVVDLKKLIEWCQNSGSKYAKVEKMDVQWLEATGELGGFIVR